MSILEGNFEQDGYRFEVDRCQYTKASIEIYARAFYNDRQIGFGADGSTDIERFVIVNPPSLLGVDDGPVGIGKRRFIQKPANALRRVMFDTIRDVGKRDADIIKGKIGRTTYTIFGDVGDGWINSSDSASNYTTARSGSALAADSAAGTFRVGQHFNGITTYECSEGFISFDTSAVVDTISAATLSLVPDDEADNSATDFTCNARRLDWATLTTADWIAGASLSAQTLLATLSTSGVTLGAYNAFTSGANFLTNINQSGATGIILSSSRHEGNNTPTGDEYMLFVSADTFGTTLDPKLVVVASASTSIPPKMNHYRQQGMA